MADDLNRLQRITLPTPNPALSQFLKSGRCRDMTESLTSQVFNLYQASLPVRTGNLKAGAYYYMALGGWGDGGFADRWFGYVGNNALSYRKQRGVPYAGFIEYGKNGKGGQGQLRQAGAAVFGDGFPNIYRATGAPRTYNKLSPEGNKIKRDTTKLGQQIFRDRKGQFTSSPTRKRR